MSTTEIVQNPATSLSMETDLTFAEFSKMIRQKNARPIKYQDGSSIEIKPDTDYSFLMLGLERLLTTEEFAKLYTIIMQGVQQAETQGIIPKNLIKSISTPFDVSRPHIPTKYADEIPDNIEIKTYLDGSMTFRVEAVELPEVIVDG